MAREKATQPASDEMARALHVEHLAEVDGETGKDLAFELIGSGQCLERRIWIGCEVEYLKRATGWIDRPELAHAVLGEVFLLRAEVELAGARAQDLDDQVRPALDASIGKDAEIVRRDVEYVWLVDVDLVQIDVQGGAVNLPAASCFDPVSDDQVEILRNVLVGAAYGGRAFEVSEAQSRGLIDTAETRDAFFARIFAKYGPKPRSSGRRAMVAKAKAAQALALT